MSAGSGPAPGELLLGRIRRPWGREGELLVDPETDWPELRFAPGGTVTVRSRSGETMRFHVAGLRAHGGRFLLRLEGVEAIGAAEPLRGGLLVAREEELAAVPGRELRQAELIGMEVVGPDGARLGVALDVIEAPAANLLEVRLPSGGTALVPLTAPIFRGADRRARRVEIDPPPGLLDDAEAIEARPGDGTRE